MATTVTIYRLCVDGDVENRNDYPGRQSADWRHGWNGSWMRLTLAIDRHRRSVAAERTGLIVAGSKELLRVLLGARQSRRERRRGGVGVRRVRRDAGQERRQRTRSVLRRQLDRCLVVRAAGGGTCSFTAGRGGPSLVVAGDRLVGEVPAVAGRHRAGRREARLVADVREQLALDADSRSAQRYPGTLSCCPALLTVTIADSQRRAAYSLNLQIIITITPTISNAP